MDNRITDNKNRIEWIDCAKGIGIILMVLGHTFFKPEYISTLINSFHMPLFFILSGLTAKPKDTFSFTNIKHLSKIYLLPYYLMGFTNLIIWSLWQLYLKEFTLAGLGKYCIGLTFCIANHDWMPNCTPLWFLPALFIAKLLFDLITTIIPKKFQDLPVLLFAAVSYIAFLLEWNTLPYMIFQAFMGLIFVWIGYRFKKLFINDNQIIIRLVISILWLILIPIILRNDPIGMYANDYGNNFLLSITSAITGSMFIIEISKLLYKIKFLTVFLGQNTLVVMGFNYFARTFSNEFYYLVPVIKEHKLHWSVSFLLTTAVLLVMVTAEIFLLNHKDKFYFNKKSEV